MFLSETDFETLKTCTLVFSLTEWNIGFPIQKSGFRFADWLKGTQLKLQKKLILTAIGFSSVSASCKINQFCKLFGHWVNDRLALLSRGKPQIPIRVDYSRPANSQGKRGFKFGSFGRLYSQRILFKILVVYAVFITRVFLLDSNQRKR